ncbi:MAG: class I SAM-dependent methyltransferase [Verrucomicrobiia bacterium]
MNELFEIIKKKIEENNGFITFEKFMEMCLYQPGLGYYESVENSPGREGDFITSVSVGYLFGYLLAFKFNKWLAELEAKVNYGDNLFLIEAGAHDGSLALDVLNWFYNYSKKRFDGLKYLIIEPSPVRREWQKYRLKQFSEKVLWYNSFNDAAESINANEGKSREFTGIVFSNELLDSFPVHRLVWDARLKRWFEMAVCCENESFKYARVSLSDECAEYVNRIDSSLLDFIPDGFVCELSVKALDWWKMAAAFLKRGKLLTIDYGYNEPGILNPHYFNGTLRAYNRHRSNTDLLTNFGQQDITFSVNFSLFIETAERQGMSTEYFGSQEEFFVQIIKEFVAGETPHWFASNLSQFKTLVHPEHFGRQMKVLVQSKN